MADGCCPQCRQGIEDSPAIQTGKSKHTEMMTSGNSHEKCDGEETEPTEVKRVRTTQKDNGLFKWGPRIAYGLEEQELIEAAKKVGYQEGETFFSGRALNDVGLETAQYLIRNGVDVDVHDNETGSTPLIHAIQCCNFKIADILIQAGADINLPNRAGVSPLHMACMISGHAVSFLLERGANFDLKTKDGIPIIEWAEKNNLTYAVEIISSWKKRNQKTKWWQFWNKKASNDSGEKVEFPKSSESKDAGDKIKISIWNCPKCGYNFRIRERAVKEIMNLTCRCGWQGKIDTDNKVVLAEKEHELIGTVHVGYKIIAATEAPTKYPPRLVPAESIVFAKRISDSTPTRYVIWEYVGNGEFRSGIYKDDEKEAWRIFNSQASSTLIKVEDATQVVQRDEYIDACFSIEYNVNEELCKHESQEQRLIKEEKDNEIFDLFSIYGKNKKEEAFELAKSLTNDMKDWDVPYTWISRIFREEKKYKEAKEAITIGLKNAKRKRVLCGHMAVIYEEENNIAERVKWLIRSMIIEFRINEFNEPHWVDLGAIASVLGLDTESSKLKGYCRNYELAGEAVSEFRQQLENNIHRESIRAAIQRFVKHIETEDLTTSITTEINAPKGVYCASCKNRFKLEKCIEPQLDTTGETIIFTCPHCKINMAYNPKTDKCLGWD